MDRTPVKHDPQRQSLVTKNVAVPSPLSQQNAFTTRSRKDIFSQYVGSPRLAPNFSSASGSSPALGPNQSVSTGSPTTRDVSDSLQGVSSNNVRAAQHAFSRPLNASNMSAHDGRASLVSQRALDASLSEMDLEDDSKQNLLEATHSISYVGNLPHFSRDEINTDDAANSGQGGKSGMRRNISAPALGRAQQNKLDSGMFMTESQLPKSLSHDILSYSRDPIVSQLIEMPLIATTGMGSDLKHEIRRQMKLYLLQMHAVQEQEQHQQQQQRVNGPDATRGGKNASEMQVATKVTKRTKGTKGTNEEEDDKFVGAAGMKESVGELETLMEHQGWNIYLFYCVMQGIIGTFLFGYNTTVLNVPRDNITNHLKYTSSDTVIDQMNTFFVAGQLVGSLMGGALSSKFGRKGALLMFCDVIYILAGVLLFFFASESYYVFAVGRVLCGVGSGIALCIAPSYLGEISPPLIRGAVGTCNQVMITSGIFIAAAVGYPSVLGKENWPYLLLFNAVPPALQLVLACTFPESPKWLLQNDKEDDAKSSLQKLRMTDNVKMDLMLIKAALTQNTSEPQESSPPKSQNKMKRGYANLNSSPQSGSLAQPLNSSVSNTEPPQSLQYPSSLRSPLHPKPAQTSQNTSSSTSPDVVVGPQWTRADLAQQREQNRLQKRAVYWALTIAVVAMCLQQLSGINTVFFYSASLLSGAGLTRAVDQWYGTMGICLANIVGVLMATALIDRLGRVRLLLISAAGMILFAGVISVCMIEQDASAWFGYGAIGAMAMYCVMFEFGLGPIPWTLAAEVSPSAKLGLVTTVGNVVNASANMAISQFANAVVGFGKYFPFIGVLVFGMVFIWKFLPETKGRTETEIQNEMQKKPFCGV